MLCGKLGKKAFVLGKTLREPLYALEKAAVELFKHGDNVVSYLISRIIIGKIRAVCHKVLTLFRKER